MATQSVKVRRTQLIEGLKKAQARKKQELEAEKKANVEAYHRKLERDIKEYEKRIAEMKRTLTKKTPPRDDYYSQRNFEANNTVYAQEISLLELSDEEFISVSTTSQWARLL